jgi:hypothetical protein
MDKPLSSGLRLTFLIHAVVSLVFGVSLFILPRLVTMLVRWPQADPLITRLLGAALLALAVSSWMGYRATRREEVTNAVTLEMVFTVASCIALLRHLLFLPTPAFAWVILVIMALFALAWIFFYFKRD